MKDKIVPIILITLIIVCCCCIILLGGTLSYLRANSNTLPTATGVTPYFFPTTEIPRTGIPLTGIPATLTPLTDLPPTFEVTKAPTDIVTTETLETLRNTIVPINDLRELACRLEENCGIPETVSPPAAPLTVGTSQAFWVLNTDSNSYSRVTAILRYVTPHVYFWVQDGRPFNEQDMRNLVEAFENQIYPTNREFFGSEWTPGVDGDVHLHILYTSGLGYGVLGLFGSSDEYSPLAQQYSNAHEMFYISADNLGLKDEDAYSTLAHEFQHMIHWYQDRNENSWMNEGFSELAILLNGYKGVGHEYSYIIDPDIQLTDWPNDPGPFSTSPHYGAGFLFATYFLDRFGDEATQALVRDQQNGLEGVDSILLQINAYDPLTGQPITAEDFFQDWTITNYIHDTSVADGRYFYSRYPDAPQTSETETISSCPLDSTGRTVHQYGVDYIRITCRGAYTLHFTGDISTRLLPADPHSGSYAFWSNKGDESDMTLTREFDFSEVSGPLAFAYWTWYDLEKDYDYLYLEASTDGQHWNILITPSGTAEDPSGNSYGWGYNGVSGRWTRESVDLAQYAGQKVYLRFEYVTDAAVNGEGLLLDDISIPATGYSEDFETGDGGWQAAGFARVQNILPQTFSLAIISKYADRTEVQIVPLSINRTADIPLTIGQNGLREVVLVVSGTTRFTREQAIYQIEIR